MEKITTVVPKSLEEAYTFLKSRIHEKTVIIVVGSCRVEYEGRAASRISEGERILIIKKDKAVLLHRPFGYEPVNWQPSSSIVSINLQKDSVRMDFIRDRPHEVLRLEFSDIYFIGCYRIEDHAEFEMYGCEKDMQEAIVLEPEAIEEGLNVLEVEKKVSCGVIDVYGMDKEGRIVIMELKKDKAGKEAVLQLKRYVNVVGRELGKNRVRGILVAPDVKSDAFKLLKELNLEFKRFTPKMARRIIRKHKVKTIDKY